MSESDIYELLGAFTALGAGALSLGMIIAIIVLPIILALVLHYVEAIPVFKIAKKMGVDKAWIALIPIKLCSTYVLSCIPGNREIDFFGKFKCFLQTVVNGIHWTEATVAVGRIKRGGDDSIGFFRCFDHGENNAIDANL